MPLTAHELLIDGVLSIKESAAFLSCCEASIYNILLRGELPSVTIPGLRSRRIPKRALVEFLATRLTGSTSDTTDPE